MLYFECLKLCNEYLGKTSEDFLNRQIRIHLLKTPEELNRNDIEKLATWIGISAALVIKDEQAMELKDKVLLLKNQF